LFKKSHLSPTDINNSFISTHTASSLTVSFFLTLLSPRTLVFTVILGHFSHRKFHYVSALLPQQRSSTGWRLLLPLVQQ